jgi:hypothetical protein
VVPGFDAFVYAGRVAESRTTQDSAKDIDTPRRKALHAYLSDEAHRTWHEVASDNGVSVSALLEAMAAGLSEAKDTAGAAVDIVARARRVDAERRRR